MSMGEGSSKGWFWLARTLGGADLVSVAALGHGHDATRHKAMLPLSHTRAEWWSKGVTQLCLAGQKEQDSSFL